MAQKAIAITKRHPKKIGNLGTRLDEPGRLLDGTKFWLHSTEAGQTAIYEASDFFDRTRPRTGAICGGLPIWARTHFLSGLAKRSPFLLFATWP